MTASQPRPHKSFPSSHLGVRFGSNGGSALHALSTTEITMPNDRNPRADKCAGPRALSPSRGASSHSRVERVSALCHFL